MCCWVCECGHKNCYSDLCMNPKGCPLGDGMFPAAGGDSNRDINPDQEETAGAVD